MKYRFNKALSVGLAIILGVMTITGCGSGGASEVSAKDAANEKTAGITATKIRVATQPGVYAANILWAKKNGYFEKELEQLGYTDIEVTWDSFESGPPENEAFAAGEEDIGLIGDVPLLIAKASGQKTVTFAKLSSGEQTVALTVPVDSDINDPAQLKGKKVAYVKGSYGQHFLGLVLKNAGLTFDDIEEVNLPNADIGNAVVTKQVEAGIIWEPGLTSTLSTGQIKVLLDGTGIKSNNVFFFATQSFANENPDALVAFIRAVEKANEDIKNDPITVANSLTEEINLTSEVLQELFSEYNYSSFISSSDIDELKDVENFNRDQGFAENTVDVDSFVDLKFLEKAGVSGE